MYLKMKLNQSVAELTSKVMEKIKSFVFVLAFVFYPIISHAQVRRIEEVSAIIKDISYSQNFEYYDIIFGWKTAPYNFVSLKDIEKENLTEVEKDLLKQYEDVAFCFRKGKIHHCYWVKDENARTGLVKFDGTVLIPPVSGRYFPAPTSKTVIVGEVTLTPNLWAANYYNSLTYLNSLGFGQFKAVVEDIENILNFEEEYIIDQETDRPYIATNNETEFRFADFDEKVKLQAEKDGTGTTKANLFEKGLIV